MEMDGGTEMRCTACNMPDTSGPLWEIGEDSYCGNCLRQRAINLECELMALTKDAVSILDPRVFRRTLFCGFATGGGINEDMAIDATNRFAAKYEKYEQEKRAKK
jgi:hypothetical protein